MVACMIHTSNVVFVHTWIWCMIQIHTSNVVFASCDDACLTGELV
jgi:hypothetical protein